MSPDFDLDSTLTEAVLLEAAERAEAKASLAKGNFEATLPIQTTSPEETPRETRVPLPKRAPSESKECLKAAEWQRSPYEPHAQKREQSLPRPWTPDGSPPMSESERLDEVPSHVELHPIQCKQRLAPKNGRHAEDMPPHQSPCDELEEVRSSASQENKPLQEDAVHLAAARPPALPDTHGLPRLDLIETSRKPKAAESPEMPSLMADPWRRRSIALGSSHRTSHSPPWRRDRYRTRSPRWGSSHKVNRFPTRDTSLGTREVP